MTAYQHIEPKLAHALAVNRWPYFIIPCQHFINTDEGYLEELGEAVARLRAEGWALHWFSEPSMGNDYRIRLEAPPVRSTR